MRTIHPLLGVLCVAVVVGGCRSTDSARHQGDHQPAYVMSGPPEAPIDAPVTPSPRTTDSADAVIPETSSETFATPAAAMQAVAAIAASHDHDRAVRVFGADCRDLLGSDDTMADDEDCARVSAMILEGAAFEEADGHTIALIGAEKWRFPIPLVKHDAGFRFDVAAGREFMRTQQIGENELLTAQALEEYAEAQHEYAAESRPGTPRAFAAKFQGDASARDGLHWTAADGERRSPVGPMMARAAFGEPVPSGTTPAPFNGYWFKCLKAQGKHAPGGERAYTDDAGHLVHGCGAIAWPSTYGETGVMTFMVNHAGIVFEKDLGAATSQLAPTLTAFVPDDSWRLSEN